VYQNQAGMAQSAVAVCLYYYQNRDIVSLVTICMQSLLITASSLMLVVIWSKYIKHAPDAAAHPSRYRATAACHTVICITVPTFIKIGQAVTEKSRFVIFKMQPPGMLKNSKF